MKQLYVAIFRNRRRDEVWRLIFIYADSIGGAKALFSAHADYEFPWTDISFHELPIGPTSRLFAMSEKVNDFCLDCYNDENQPPTAS